MTAPASACFPSGSLPLAYASSDMPVCSKAIEFLERPRFGFRSLIVIVSKLFHHRQESGSHLIVGSATVHFYNESECSLSCRPIHYSNEVITGLRPFWTEYSLKYHRRRWNGIPSNPAKHLFFCRMPSLFWYDQESFTLIRSFHEDLPFEEEFAEPNPAAPQLPGFQKIVRIFE